MQELKSNSSQSFDSAINSFANSYAESLIKFYKEDLSWADTLVKTCFEVVETVCPSARCRDDKMNVNKYVKITESKAPKNDCLYFRGGLINTSYSLHLLRILEFPSILFINTVLPVSETPANLQEDLPNLWERALSLGTSIVLCPCDLPEQLIELITKSGVPVILDLDKSEFYELARLTQGKVLSSLKQIEELNDFLGKCSKIIPMSYLSQNFLFFVDIFDYSLGGSILLNGANTKNIARITEKLITALRNAKLERIFLFECGSVLDDFSLIGQYYENVWLKFIKVCAGLCGSFINKFVKIYRKGDLSLGKFISEFVDGLGVNCEECGVANSKHLNYCFNKEKILKILVSESKFIDGSNIFFSINCGKCSWALAPHFISNATWEYSYHKFLFNFFCQNNIRSQCGHDLFQSTFHFQLKSTKISFSTEPLPYYSLCFPEPAGQNIAFFTSLLNESLNELQVSSKLVLDQILENAKELVKQISEAMAKSSLYFDSLLKLRNLLLVEIEKLYETMHDIFTTDSHKFSHYLDVQVMRKALYMECCRAQIQVKSIEKKYKKLLNDYRKQNEDEKLSMKKINEAGPSIIFSLVQDEDLVPIYEKFYSGTLTFPLCKSFFVPVYEDDLSSFISHALSSFAYNSEIISHSISTGSDLLNTTSLDWVFSASSFEGMPIKETHKKFYGSSNSFTCTCLYFLQFHSLRQLKQVENLDFLLSLSRSTLKKDNVGKSTSIFRQSHDHRYIIKLVSEREIKMFQAMAWGYFAHMACNQDSILNTCLGVYKIVSKFSGKAKISYVMVYDKIGYGLAGPNIVYDLKGTMNKRRKVKDGDNKTKMDLNFVEDFKSVPLPIQLSDLHRLSKSLEKDSSFLKSCNVIDYSLLLVINRSTRRVVVGIIDYLQHYTFDKVIENTYKSVVGSEMPTVVDPTTYRSRFFDTIVNKYFMTGDQ